MNPQHPKSERSKTVGTPSDSGDAPAALRAVSIGVPNPADNSSLPPAVSAKVDLPEMGAGRLTQRAASQLDDLVVNGVEFLQPDDFQVELRKLFLQPQDDSSAAQLFSPQPMSRPVRQRKSKLATLIPVAAVLVSACVVIYLATKSALK